MSSRDRRLTACVVEPLLRGRFGRPYLWSESCTSTQDALRASGLPEGAVATAEHQTAGRGREGRRWEDAGGKSLLLSVLLRPPSGSAAQQLSLVAALALAETLEEATSQGVGVKWPNDLLLGGRKVAGMLLESSGDEVVCGVGVNVSQTEAELPVETRLPAASLLTAAGRAPDRAGLLASFLETLERRYDVWRPRGLAPLLDELEARNALRGRAVRVGDAVGAVERISADGRLALRLRDGTETLVASGELVEIEMPD